MPFWFPSAVREPAAKGRCAVLALFRTQMPPLLF
jgi:hypothetical protein